MRKITPVVFFAYILVISLCGCSKDEKEVTPKAPSGAPTGGNGNGSGGGSGGNISCSTISASNSVGGYQINALTVSSNAIGIELANSSSGNLNVSIGLLQVTRGNDCVESTDGVEVSGSLNKYFEFKNLPDWATTSAVVTKVRITINGTNYALQDLKINM